MDAASTLNPQGASVSLLEPPVEPGPLSRFLIFVGAVAFAVVDFVGVVGRGVGVMVGADPADTYFLPHFGWPFAFLFAKTRCAYR
jgi:hypothetical protein